MIDAHCHLDDPRFDLDREEVLRQGREAGVTAWLVAGVDPHQWARGAALARSRADIGCAYGLHPWAVARMGSMGEVEQALAILHQRLEEEEAAGLGETGLDASRFVPDGTLPLQTHAFIQQVGMSREKNLPLVLHVLKAHDSALALLRREGVGPAGGMVHSFSGSAEQAREYLRLGLHLSFGPSVCRPDAEKLRRAAREVPQDRLLAETDCPDQPPPTHAGARNEPRWLTEVMASLAEIRREDPSKVAEFTAENARTLFHFEEGMGFTTRVSARRWSS